MTELATVDAEERLAGVTVVEEHVEDAEIEYFELRAAMSSAGEVKRVGIKGRFIDLLLPGLSSKGTSNGSGSVSCIMSFLKSGVERFRPNAGRFGPLDLDDIARIVASGDVISERNCAKDSGSSSGDGGEDASLEEADGDIGELSMSVSLSRKKSRTRELFRTMSGISKRRRENMSRSSCR